MTRLNLMIPTLAFMLAPMNANAETALEAALAGGAEQLSTEEIAERIVGNTVTARKGQASFLFHYSAENVLQGRMIDGEWADRGYYGITDDSRVCLSMTPDKGRLRCLTLVRQDDVISKYTTSGEKSFELLAFEDGNTL